ncbi:uncharacterized protein F4812DRAFT_427631 [Daldinia caldariorum]|uniref:uncharacterized protein n=1 Tax=Daldinia caldariorum TaxID=326644 RepID=UPI00200895AA|nr:uncharacterized protein F4812DRAFT_427631 [Daldinia caldariorum]KAI1467803.1 hypothetical protein F4812DRAFT_427631 [Daldinia caldariorum]
MKFSISFTTQLLALGALSHASASDTSGDSDSDYILSVCSPAQPPDQTDPAPCVAIQNIETACLPNGTSPLALSAHAQCLCGGSYFAEWLGCRRCLLTHGALSQRNFTYFSAVLSSASAELCAEGATPTAAFATLFTEAQAGVPEPTGTGGTQLTDAKSGDAAVSLYYTASGPQGPGRITGSATAATAEVSETGTGAGTTATATGGVSQNGSGGARSTSNRPSATTSSSSNVAIPTGAPGNGKGAIFAAAVGGALMAVL